MGVRARRRRLVGSETVGAYVGVNEVLRRHWGTGQAPQHRQLAHVSEDVRQRSLEDLRGRE
jgi:hypothetical protein